MSAPEHAAGWDLVVAAQAGDREAFGRLYACYAGRVAGYVGRRVPDRYLAQDLTGETFARALHGIGSVCDRGRDVGAWFITIAHNLVVDHWKSQHTRRSAPVAEVPEAGSEEAGPEQTVIAWDTADRVRWAMAQLPAGQRECVRLRFWQGLSGSETAAVMGHSVAAVKALQHRGVAALRAQLTGTEQTPAAGVDPVARARARVGHAVSEVSVRVAGGQRQQTGEQAWVRRSGWVRSGDRTVTGQDRGRPRDVLGVSEGVA